MKVAARVFFGLLVVALLALIMLPASPQAAEKPSGIVMATLENMNAAYNGEKNANARYMAFAERADEEGYGKAASLFRAAARAEQVHFERHAKVIKDLGGTPKATIETPDVKSTKENLEAAVKGETYESQTMYPEFLTTAEKDKVEAAIDPIEDAMKAEAVHAKLYQRMLDDLEAQKGDNIDLFVCPKCGNVLYALTGPCIICMTEPRKFITVS